MFYTIVGTQWGDEGKGKIVDWLSSEADVIVRFQGGHNAGHTLVIDGVVYKLRLLISLISAHGSKTTPFPIAHFLLLIIPEGSKLSL